MSPAYIPPSGPTTVPGINLLPQGVPPGPARRAVSVSGGLAELPDGTVTIDLDAWSAGSYEPNTIVRREAAAGQGIWYLQADVSATTAEPPASPWVVLGHSTGAAIRAAIDAVEGNTDWRTGGSSILRGVSEIEWAAFGNTLLPMATGSIASGTITGTADAQAGVMQQVRTASGGTDSGMLFSTGSGNLCYCVPTSRFVGLIRLDASPTNKRVRVGWAAFGFGSTATGAEGAYVDIDGTTASFTVRTGASDTTSGTTATLTADELYLIVVEVGASSTVFVIYDDTGAVVETVTVAAVPSTSVAGRSGFQAWRAGTATLVENVVGIIKFYARIANYTAAA